MNCVLATLVLLFMTVFQAGAITIDGDFTDWKDIAPMTTGLLGESVGDGAADGNDVETVWMASDQDNLYLSVKCTGPIKSSMWGPTLVAIDSDLNPSTGFQSFPLGVDYFIQPWRDLSGKLLIHRRQKGEDNQTWVAWHAAVEIDNGYAIGRGEDSTCIEMRIPWCEIGVKDKETAVLRYRICDAGGLLNPVSGDWAPDIKSAYFFYGKDLMGLNNSKDLCTNGSFEHLEEAAARPLPQGWTEMRQGQGCRIEMSEDAVRGKRSLRLAAPSESRVGMNSSPIAIGHGLVRFRYKALKSSVEGGNLSMFVIGLNGPNGTEVQRQAYHPPKEHVGDGQWHEGSLEFDFSSQRASHCLVAPRINEATACGEGDWLIDAVEVYAVRIGAQVKIAHVWSDKPLVKAGDTVKFSVWVENSGDEDAVDVSARLTASGGMTVIEPVKTVAKLDIGSFERLDWAVKAEKSGPVGLEVSATYRDSVNKADNAPRNQVNYRILVIDPSVKYTRQELCTDEKGYWRLLERPSTLQNGNKAALAAVKHKKSSEIKRSTYGICAHLPRSKDYEDPFNPVHLIDGNADTYWSSQQNSSQYPGVPPWVQIDLGRAVTVKQINLIPYWHNTDFPIGFSVQASLDGKKWDTVLNVTDYRFADSDEKRGDKIVQPFKPEKSTEARHIRLDFTRLPMSGGNYAEVSTGYKARLSGIEVIDEKGHNTALKDTGASVKASDVFTGWQNTAKTVNESFDRIFDLGLKWVRVGQWGDQTEWAAVEREKGKYQIDPVTDKGIRKLLDNGVDILYGLQYGNNLYEPRDTPFFDIGPIFTEGSPFYWHCGPRTEEGRQAFANYVDFVVRKYGDRIKYWELWNEENGWYPGFEPELYGKLLTVVAKRIKSIDSSAKVMFGGTAAPAPITTEISLREGAAPYIDLAAFHPYGIDKPEGGMGTMEMHQGNNLGQTREQTGWNHLEEIVEGVKKPFAQHGKPDVEVWLNEWGTNLTGLDFTYNPGIGEYGSAKYLTRFYIYSGWLGHPTAWWGLYNLNKSQDWGIFDQRDYGFRPMSHALQNVCSVVSDVEPVRSLEYKYDGQAPDPKVISYTKDGSGDRLVLVWAAESFNDQVKSYPSKLSFKMDTRPSNVTLTDLYWGVSQPAVWSYEDGNVIIDDLIVRDYPVVLTCSK